MSPRTLAANFRGIERMTRRARDEARTTDMPQAVVRDEDGRLVMVRPLHRALTYVYVHPQAEIVATVYPDGAT